VTTCGLPALGNEPVCLEHPFFWGGQKFAKRRHCPNFLAKILLFLEIILLDCALLRSALPQVCLLATFLMLPEKSMPVPQIMTESV